MNSCGTGIPVFTRIPPDSCSRQTLSCSGQLTKSPPTSSPTSKLTTLQTPKHAPKHVVYSMQYHLLLQLNLNTKIVRCCCRHLRHSIFVPSPVLPHFLLDIITTVFAWRWRDPPPPVYLQFALAGCRVASCGSTSTSTSRLYDALPASRVLLQQNICLSSYQGAAGFRDAIASCLLAPPPVCLLFPGWLS